MAVKRALHVDVIEGQQARLGVVQQGAFNGGLVIVRRSATRMESATWVR
jgi:hypothetical protein